MLNRRLLIKRWKRTIYEHRRTFKSNVLEGKNLSIGAVQLRFVKAVKGMGCDRTDEGYGFNGGGFKRYRLVA
jgi:hypothetical protein